ncbi:MAG TPA: pentapeptide repeat-containing protein, partial [Polyangia bacterium]|nr:pentapeptide repeat-containing protein [Polyangia bacterium]
MSRAQLAFAFALGLALAAAGCASESIDPCAGRTGACVGVHVATQVQPIDQLRVTLDRAQSMLTPTVAAGALDFPVRFAVMLPAGATGAHLDFDGLLAGASRAQASGDVVLGASGHATLDVTLTASAPDGGADFANADFAGADLAGLDLAGADFAGADFAPILDLAGVDLAGARVTLTTSAVTISGGSGSVAPLTTPVGACGTGCSLYPVGASVTITATPGSSSVFLGWAGVTSPSCQGPSSCSLTLGADTGVVAVFSSAPMNRVFATSTTYTPAQLGNGAVNADGF